MELKKIAANQTQINLASGTQVLFSYETPVAARMADGRTYRTSKTYSPTTTKHLNKWLADAESVEECYPSFLEGLLITPLD
jgi:hypothetical protein